MRIHPHDIASYPDYRPERALLSWFEAIARRDYRRAMDLSRALAQGVDRRAMPEKLLRLHHQAFVETWRDRRIDGVRITGIRFRRSENREQRGIAWAEATVMLDQSLRSSTGRYHRVPSEHLRLILIREADDGQSDVRGEWRVSWNSMRGVDEESVAPAGEIGA